MMRKHSKNLKADQYLVLHLQLPYLLDHNEIRLHFTTQNTENFLNILKLSLLSKIYLLQELVNEQMLSPSLLYKFLVFIFSVTSIRFLLCYNFPKRFHLRFDVFFCSSKYCSELLALDLLLIFISSTAAGKLCNLSSDFLVSIFLHKILNCLEIILFHSILSLLIKKINQLSFWFNKYFKFFFIIVHYRSSFHDHTFKGRKFFLKIYFFILNHSNFIENMHLAIIFFL